MISGRAGFRSVRRHLQICTRVGCKSTVLHDSDRNRIYGAIGMDDFDGQDGMDPVFATQARARAKRPPLYRVMMFNDDYTPMEFVVATLVGLFGKTTDEAGRIALRIHRRGVGVCGMFTYEIAETKMIQVLELARENRHPLQCMIEPA